MDAYTKINDIIVNKGVNGSPTTVNLSLASSTILYKMLLFGLTFDKKYIQILFEIKSANTLLLLARCYENFNLFTIKPSPKNRTCREIVSKSDKL